MLLRENCHDHSFKRIILLNVNSKKLAPFRNLLSALQFHFCECMWCARHFQCMTVFNFPTYLFELSQSHFKDMKTEAQTLGNLPKAGFQQGSGN